MSKQARVEFKVSFWVTYPDDDLEADAAADRISDEILAAIEKVEGVDYGSVQSEGWDEGE